MSCSFYLSPQLNVFFQQCLFMFPNCLRGSLFLVVLGNLILNDKDGHESFIPNNLLLIRLILESYSYYKEFNILILYENMLTCLTLSNE